MVIHENKINNAIKFYSYCSMRHNLLLNTAKLQLFVTLLLFAQSDQKSSN